MFRLESLKKLTKKRKRIGRGGSRGGTSGRGSKGQKARTGHHGEGYGFEGGQTPLARRLPKRGFNNKDFARVYAVVNIGDLDARFQAGEEVTAAELMARNLISLPKGSMNSKRCLIKVLGMGQLSKKLTVVVDAVSKTAREAIEKAGGSVVIS